MNQIQSLVREIEAIGKKKVFRKKASELRQKLAQLMDKDEMFVGGFYLQKQRHAWGDTVAFFSPEKWDKYQTYLHGDPDRKTLDWIK